MTAKGTCADTYSLIGTLDPLNSNSIIDEPEQIQHLKTTPALGKYKPINSKQIDPTDEDRRDKLNSTISVKKTRLGCSSMEIATDTVHNNIFRSLEDSGDHVLGRIEYANNKYMEFKQKMRHLKNRQKKQKYKSNMQSIGQGSVYSGGLATITL